MRTRANKNYVASDRARRENVPRHILCSVRGGGIYSIIGHNRERIEFEAFSRRKEILLWYVSAGSGVYYCRINK